MIELKNLGPSIIRFVENSCSAFTAQHPEVRVSCFGFFCQGYYGSAIAFLDTAAHAEAKVREYDNYLAGMRKDKATEELMGRKKFRRWLQVLEGRGKDSIGRFNTSCNDFAHGVGELTFPGWPEPHTETEGEVGRWDFLWQDGRVVTADSHEGNRGIDRVIFPFLVECLQSVDFSRLRTEDIFRVGVEMHDESYVKFWAPRMIPTDGYQSYEYNYTQLGF